MPNPTAASTAVRVTSVRPGSRWRMTAYTAAKTTASAMPAATVPRTPPTSCPGFLQFERRSDGALGHPSTPMSA